MKQPYGQQNAIVARAAPGSSKIRDGIMDEVKFFVNTIFNRLLVSTTELPDIAFEEANKIFPEIWYVKFYGILSRMMFCAMTAYFFTDTFIHSTKTFLPVQNTRNEQWSVDKMTRSYCKSCCKFLLD